MNPPEDQTKAFKIIRYVDSAKLGIIILMLLIGIAITIFLPIIGSLGPGIASSVIYYLILTATVIYTHFNKGDIIKEVHIVLGLKLV